MHSLSSSPSLSIFLSRPQYQTNVCNHVTADVAPAHVVAADEDDAAVASALATAAAAAAAATVYPTICV